MRLKVFLVLCVSLLSISHPSFAEELFSFQGQIDFSQKQFHFAVTFPSLTPSETGPSSLDGRQSVVFNAVQISKSDYRFFLDVDHVRTPLFDLLSKIESSVEVVSGGQGAVPVARRLWMDKTVLRGKIWSRYSLVDYHPIRELLGQFEIKDGRLYVDALSFGNVSCRGEIGLSKPYPLDWVVSLDHVDMRDFLSFWSMGKKYEAAGSVSGRIKISGSLGRPALNGNLESRDGFIGDLEYNSILLNAGGIYPKIEVSHSSVSKTDGVSFLLSGAVDLSDQENFKKQVMALKFSPLVSESLSGREWTIKRLQKEGASTTELKYLFQKRNDMNISLPLESDMFGFEQSVEF